MKKVKCFQQVREEGGYKVKSFAKLDTILDEITIFEFNDDHLGITISTKEMSYKKTRNPNLFEEKKSEFSSKKWKPLSNESFETNFLRFQRVSR